MNKYFSSFVVERHKPTMPQLLFLMLSYATLSIVGCVGNPSLSTSTEADQKVETIKPVKPRPIEEWTNPNDQELARRLMTIDEHRRKLNSLINDFWNTKTAMNRAGRDNSAVLTTDSSDRLMSSSDSVQLAKIAPILSQFSSKLKHLSWYPPIARKNGWEGQVIIDVLVRENGEFVSARISKSSGYPILDYSALETVRQACPLYLKEPLEHPAISVRVPIIYKLDQNARAIN